MVNPDHISITLEDVGGLDGIIDDLVSLMSPSHRSFIILPQSSPGRRYEHIWCGKKHRSGFITIFTM